MKYRLLAASVALLSASAAAYAAPFPLTASAAPTTPLQELTAPFILSDGLTQSPVINRNTLAAKGLPANITAWDMTAFDLLSKNIYVPAESGGGVFRYNLKSGKFKMLTTSNGGPRITDPLLWNPLATGYSSLDPVTRTPWKTVLSGEETGGGRLFEIKNPNANGAPIVNWLSKIPAVAHEGLRFDKGGNLYFIDEDNSGSLYKFVPSKKGNLMNGQTFVLKVNTYAGVASESWDSVANAAATRVGAATWVPMTNAKGVPLTPTNPFVYTSNSGAIAANELGATPYGRPEDMTFKTLASGNEAFFVTTTSEHRMYSVELTGGNTAMVRVFADRNTTDLATGVAVGTALANPDNAETDADGTSIYIVEDNNPGDIWKALDANNDGIAEAMGRWISLGVVGSEPTGLERDPNDPKRFFVNIQHPTSNNDATWEIRLP